MSNVPRVLFQVCFIGNLIAIGVSLHWWGAVEIRKDWSEVVCLTFISGCWLALTTRLFSWLGLSVRDDIVERKNVSALIALCGGVIALSLIYAGGNIGEGPSYWNNVFSVGIGTFGFFLLWVLHELGANVSRLIAEGRDPASGLRLGGFLVSIALIFSRAVAGDWHSESATLRDFIHDGWPTPILAAIALAMEKLARPTPDRPFPPWKIFGLIPALLYVFSAGLWCLHLGAWEGMPK